MSGARFYVAVVIVVLSAGCGGSVVPPYDSGVDRRVVEDATSDTSVDVAPETTHDPCTPGTCRFSSDPSGECLPPGGPIGRPDSAPSLSGCCACGSDGFCKSECVCASPDTPIATPRGDRPIASLSVGDIVFSIDHGRMAAVPVRETHRTPVTNHRVVEVVLRDGAVLQISAAHPTADGRSFGQLHEGDWIGGHEVAAATIVSYAHDATYDILPDSDTGTYFAGGALIGSTLARSVKHARPSTEACTLPSIQGSP